MADSKPDISDKKFLMADSKPDISHKNDTIYSDLMSDEFFTTEDIFDFLHPNPALTDLSLIEEQSSLLHPNPSSSNTSQIPDGNDPFSWDVDTKFNAANSDHPGPSSSPQVYPETSNHRMASENENWENVCPLPNWPEPPMPFLCSYCLVLREIIHTNGADTTKLEIHGRIGLISHAVLEIRQNTSSIANQYQMIDFCKKSTEEVRNFLVQYCSERKQAGFVMLRDPLSIFHEAICVGLDSDGNLNTDDFFQTPQGTHCNQGGSEMDRQTRQENQTWKAPKTSLAAQRERTAKLTLGDMAEYFHLPIEVAAKKLKLCPTVVKRICRRYGLERWPYRKIKKLEKKISNMQPRLNSDDAEIRTNAIEEIEKLRRQMAKACTGSGEGINR